MKRISLLIFTILFSSNCYTQNWPKIYGDDIRAYGKDIIDNYDKGYIICGSIMKNASQFMYGWLIKTDINGNMLWNKKFGDYHYENYFMDFDKTLDLGLIISGATAQQDIELDPVFVKLNICGELEWCKIFLSEGYNTASGIIALPNGGYLGMLKYYNNGEQLVRISLVKMDATGEPIWIKPLAQQDSVANEEGLFLYPTPDSNYLVSGSCFSPSIKPYFIKTDTTGEELWTLKWPVGYEGYANRVVFSNNGNIYSATGLTFPDLPRIPYLLKFNKNGDVITQYPLMGDTIQRGGAKSLLLVDDTTMYVGLTWTDDPTYYTGYSEIFKTDTCGSLRLNRQLLDDNWPPTSIIRDNDNKIVVMGYYYIDGNWDIYLWKMNENLEDDTLYTQPLTYDSLCPFEIQSDTIDLDCGLFVNINEIPTKVEYESTIKIYPNPAREWAVLTLPDVLAEGAVELVVFDVFGREVRNRRQGDGETRRRGDKETRRQGEYLPANRMLLLDVASYPAGMYVAVAVDRKGRRYTGKFVVAK